MRLIRIRRKDLLLIFVVPVLLLSCEGFSVEKFEDPEIGFTTEAPKALRNFKRAENNIHTELGSVRVIQKNSSKDEFSLIFTSFEWLDSEIELNMEMLKAIKKQSLSQDQIIQEKITRRQGVSYYLLQYTDERDDGLFHILMISGITGTKRGIVEMMLISDKEENLSSKTAARLINSFRLLKG